MISLIAPAVFQHVSHTRYTVSLESLYGYSAKYAVVDCEHTSDLATELSEILAPKNSGPEVGEIDFTLSAKANEAIELTRTMRKGGPITVKTPYTANRDIAAHGTLKYHAYLKPKSITYVCHL